MLNPQTASNGAAAAGGRAPLHDKFAAASAALTQALQRLEQAVTQETAALKQRKAADLREFNSRKSHGLLELTRAMRAIDGTTPDESTLVRVRALKAALGNNLAALEVHLRAAREVTNVVADAMRQADSDGTYSSTPARAKPGW